MQRLWKIYFWILRLLVIAKYVVTLSFLDFAKIQWESADFVLIILLVARFVGLYGFVFSEPIGRPVVWQVIFVVILFFDLSYFTHNSLADYAKIPTEFRMIGMKAATIGLVVLVNLFMFPQWLALYLYGFKCKNLWAKAS